MSAALKLHHGGSPAALRGTRRRARRRLSEAEADAIIRMLDQPTSGEALPPPRSLEELGDCDETPELPAPPAPVLGRPYVVLRWGLYSSVMAELTDETADPNWWRAQGYTSGRLSLVRDGLGAPEPAEHLEEQVARWEPWSDATEAPAVVVLEQPAEVSVGLGTTRVLAHRDATGTYVVPQTTWKQLAVRTVDAMGAAADALRRLAGPRERSEPSGDVQSRLDAIRARAGRRGRR